GNMGDVTDDTSEARFHLSGDGPFVLVFLRLHFSAGTGSADVEVKLDSVKDTYHDTSLWTLASRGTGADANMRIPAEELMHWVFEPCDELVLEWTNPHSGTMRWGAEMGLVNAADL
ncbi:hypothetical protein LCGC14_3103990, partial [marine sediment metagenome]